MTTVTREVTIVGGGWYGCHLAWSLHQIGARVRLLERSGHLFSGASGSNPARLHQGAHYPRSRETRRACQANFTRFMAAYGDLTQSIPVNLYAVARGESLVDFAQYRQTIGAEIPHLVVDRPEEYGLRYVEGALQVGERHIRIDKARAFFEQVLRDVVEFNVDPTKAIPGDLVVDCTFCSNDRTGIDRYEPCVVGLLKVPAHLRGHAVTIMDGRLPSIYPWNEDEGLASLSSALYTPLKPCFTHSEAQRAIDDLSATKQGEICRRMLEQMAHYWPAASGYELVGCKLSIRAMQSSAAASRTVEWHRDAGDARVVRLRPGKIDAIFLAEDILRAHLFEKVAC